MSKSEKAAATGNSERSDESKPKLDKWWKWLLVYPTLVVSVLSAIPTYIEAVGARMLGVPFGNYRTALKENELWKDNIDCAAAPFSGLLNPNNIEVDAVVCLSGNVLVRVKPPQARTVYRWVPLDASAVRTGSSFFVSAAHADPKTQPMQLAQGDFVVICQRWVGNGLLLRRILHRSANRCFDETVNTFTGQVIGQRPAPCVPQC